MAIYQTLSMRLFIVISLTSLTVQTGNGADLLVVKNDELDPAKRRYIIDSLPIKMIYQSSYTFTARDIRGLKMKYVFYDGKYLI